MAKRSATPNPNPATTAVEPPEPAALVKAPVAPVRHQRVEARFFHCENSNRILRQGDFVFRFKPYQFLGGSWSGIYQTIHPGEQLALSMLKDDAKSGVTEISAEEYSAHQRTMAAESRRHSDIVLPPPPDVTGGRIEDIPLAQLPASTGELPPPEPKVTTPPLASTDAALNIGPITQTEVVPPAEPAVQ